MSIKPFLTGLTLFCSTLLFGQIGHESADPKPGSSANWKTVSPGINLSFSSTNFSHSKTTPPLQQVLKTSWSQKAWKGEKVGIQAVLWSSKDFQDIELSATDLTSDSNNTISADHISISYVSYVMSDLIGNLKSGCGISGKLDSILVADRIENEQHFRYDKNTTRPIWISLDIPQNTKAGIYKGKVIAKSGNKAQEINYSIEVLNHTLPTSDQWQFHLDLWQNPFSTARYYNVEPFSDKHLEILKPYMQKLASAGQKSITASIIHDPWNGQTYDKYQTMIKWIKTKDGSWKYDYSNFDKWVRFMTGLGMGKFINCYSMIPWDPKFYYEDEATGKTTFLKAAPTSEEYKKHWLPMLKDFARHLKETGNFDRTTIAMDERPMDQMQSAIAIIKEADPSFKISLAGTYHKELSDDLADYCITLKEDMDKEVLASRKAKGLTTTYYTCCTEPFPNTFTSSGYSEATWLPWNSVQRGFDGYLRWAFDCWNKNPNLDTRFGTWLAGDAWFIYPDVKTSIRFEKLIEGIQDAEKIRIIREKLKGEGKTAELNKLESVIQEFNNKNIHQNSIHDQVIKAREYLNSL
ncbi:glycoside hydrolase domain-containing protein [Sphingobacterium spiritivorum]|uniref:DUF4091 domain-containing protein n=1 Tax=Sphingobacterium spiritivorum TaxID=258 RepID=UPI003DA57FBD